MMTATMTLKATTDSWPLAEACRPQTLIISVSTAGEEIMGAPLSKLLRATQIH